MDPSDVDLGVCSSRAADPPRPAVRPRWLAVPYALLSAAVVCDLIDLATGTAAFNAAAYWMMAAGVAGGLLAVPFGAAAWLQWPKAGPERRQGAVEGAACLVVFALFAASWWLRRPDLDAPAGALVLSFTAAVIAMATAGLRMAVYARVDEDAPPSLLPGDPDADLREHAPAVRAP